MCTVPEIRTDRDHQLLTKYKEIEPSAGEFDQHTNSFYSAYEEENEISRTSQPSALVIGTGGLRLGLSNSGDYFVAMMLKELHNEGFNNVIVNSTCPSIFPPSIFTACCAAFISSVIFSDL